MATLTAAFTRPAYGARCSGPGFGRPRVTPTPPPALGLQQFSEGQGTKVRLPRQLRKPRSSRLPGRARAPPAAAALPPGLEQVPIVIGTAFEGILVGPARERDALGAPHTQGLANTPPRQPTDVEPSFLELNGILRRGEQYLACPTADIHLPQKQRHPAIIRLPPPRRGTLPLTRDDTPTTTTSCNLSYSSNNLYNNRSCELMKWLGPFVSRRAPG